MTWASRRKIFYVSIIVLFFVFIGFLIIYPYISKAPTCVDGKQNGDETGVDCGGSCMLACTLQVDELSVLWSRVFKVVPGRYNAVAYLENQNRNTAIYKINYRFRFADKDNIYVASREGSTYVPPSGKFAIFEPAIDMGNSIPVYTSFEFTEVPIWVQVSQEKINQLKIFTSDIKLENEKTSPIMSATIKNNSLFTIPEVNIIAILYDEKGNAVSASRTFLDILRGEESKIATFTWPEPFIGTIVSREVIPIFNIFSVKLE